MSANPNLEEALDQIAYLKELAQRSRWEVACGYPYYILWGVIWVIGYIAGIWITSFNWLWPILCLCGFTGSILIYLRIKRFRHFTPALLKKLQWLTILIVALAFSFFYLFLKIPLNVRWFYGYWPFWIGIIYIANGLFIDAKLVWIGGWVALTSLVSLIIPIPFSFIWLAGSGGGGLILTGIMLRNEMIHRDR